MGINSTKCGEQKATEKQKVVLKYMESNTIAPFHD